MRVVSFDIGKKNLSVYVEDFDPESIKSIPRLLKKDRFTDNREPTAEFVDTLESLYAIGTCVKLDLYDISCGSQGSFVPEATYHALNRLLNESRDVYDSADVVLLEEQLVRRNPMAFKIAQHIYSWFLIMYGESKSVMFFPATHRNHTLGCPKRFLNGTRMKKLTKYRRKRWATLEATHLVKVREEESLTKLFQSHKKKDDLADAILDAKAWQLRVFIDKLKS